MAGEHHNDRKLLKVMNGGKIKSTDKVESAKDRENYREGWDNIWNKKKK